MIIWIMKIFFYIFCVFSPLLLNISASLRSMPFLSFILPIFAWNVVLVSLIFLKRFLVFPILCFPLFISIDHWGSLSYLSLIFFWTLHSHGHIFPFLLCFPLLFTAICKVSSDNLFFAFLHFFFLGMASCTVSWIYVHISSGTLPIRSNLLNWFVTSTV